MLPFLDECNTELLKILKASLFSTEESFRKDADYNLIYEEMTAQTVLPITANIYASLPLSPELKAKWGKCIFDHVAIGAQVQNIECKLTALFEKNNIKCAILKGSAAFMYYPAGIYRSFGDVDIFVSNEDYPVAAELMVNSGYKQLSPLYENPRNVTFEKGNVKIELHRHFFSNVLEKYDEILYRSLNDTYKKQVSGGEISVFPDAQNGLILLQHLRQHLYEGLGLRQFIDFLMFVSSVCDDKFFEEKFKPLTEKTGLTKLAKTVAYMGKQYFGLPAHITWCDDIKSQTANDLLLYIFDNGNFAVKKNEQNRSVVNIVGRKRTFTEWLKYLQRSGVSHWKAAQKHSFLKVFAIPYQIARYIKRGLKKKAIFSLFGNDQLKEAKTKRKLFSDLEI